MVLAKLLRKKLYKEIIYKALFYSLLGTYKC
jgi:hypothetical protein